ncbi:MAG: shikimate dehydrogenase [Anaerovoracaceae bacterium]
MNISGTTVMLGLIGNPTGHSKSPEMYNYCFKKYGIDCAYLAFDVAEEKVGDAIEAMRTLNMRGMNVTMPLKGAVIPYLDRLTPAAEMTGSVNTIVNDGGVLTGYCTDGMGFTGNLACGGITVKDKKITILGGGGVSSAVSAQCALEGAAELSIFNRRDKFQERLLQHAETIRRNVPSCIVNVYDLDDSKKLKKEIASSHLLVNANCVGMAPLENESLIKDTSVFRKDLTVADVVYSPAETKLLREAKACGCLTFGGLGMLLRQGAEAFRLYSSGLEMPVDEIQELLYK